MKKIAIFIFCWIVQANAEIKIATFNIQNFRASKTDQYLLKNVLDDHRADIWVVQEIVDSRGLSSFIRRNLPDYTVELSRCGGGGDQKLGFIYNTKKLRLDKLEIDRRFASMSGVDCGSLRPAVIGDFYHQEDRQTYTVVAFHLKAGGGNRNYRRRWKQYDLMQELVGSLKSQKRSNIVLAGDLNTTGYVLGDADYKQFSKMLRAIDGKSSAEDLECTSYWTGEDRHDDIEEPSILDHIVVTGSLKNRIKSVELGSHCKKVACRRASSYELGDTYYKVSDHCPIGVVID